MICPFCTHSRTNVTNSRPRKKTASVWRRRECSSCHRIFSTTESLSLQDDVGVRSRDGVTMLPYNRGVLLLSIASCFAHDAPRGRQAAWWLTETIEGSLLQMDDSSSPQTPPTATVVDAATIASSSYEVLKRYDQAAAIQYAAKHHLL